MRVVTKVQCLGLSHRAGLWVETDVSEETATLHNRQTHTSRPEKLCIKVDFQPQPFP
jgi:hypothetical protein